MITWIRNLAAHTPRWLIVVYPIAVMTLGLLFGGYGLLQANRTSGLEARLGRQNITIKHLADSTQNLASQLARRGSVSKHVLCGEDRIVLYIPALTDYIKAIVKDQADVGQKEQQYNAASQSVHDGLSPGSADACPPLPPK